MTDATIAGLGKLSGDYDDDDDNDNCCDDYDSEGLGEDNELMFEKNNDRKRRNSRDIDSNNSNELLGIGNNQHLSSLQRIRMNK